MPLGHPLQQCTGFFDIFRVEARAAQIDIRGRELRCAAHLAPVGAGHADIIEVARDLPGQGGQFSRIDDAINLDMLERFEAQRRVARGAAARLQVTQRAGTVARHGKNRMREEMYREAAPLQCEADRIDQERHVVIDHLDDGMRREIAMLLHGGIDDAHRGVPAPATLREIQVRDRRGGKFLRIAGGEIGAVHVTIIGRQVLGQVDVAHPSAQAGAGCGDRTQCAAMGFGLDLIHAQVSIQVFPDLQ